MAPLLLDFPPVEKLSCLFKSETDYEPKKVRNNLAIPKLRSCFRLLSRLVLERVSREFFEQSVKPAFK